LPNASLGSIVLADGVTAVTSGTNYSLTQIQGMQFSTASNANGGPETFSYTVTDNGTTSGSADPKTLTQSLSITVSSTNDSPVFTANDFVLYEGQALTVTSAALGATDVETADASLNFTVSNVSNGQFELASMPQSEISGFTQSQIAANEILFVHDGTESAPVFDITVSDGTGSTGPVAGNVTFTAVNDAPILTNLAGDTVNTTTWVFLDRASSSILVDNDLPADYNGATLSVANTDYQAGDLLRIDTTGTVALSGTTPGDTVSVGGVVIGTVTSYSDSNIALLLNGNSSDTDVNTILQSISFASTSTVFGARGRLSLTSMIMMALPMVVWNKAIPLRPMCR